MTTPTDDQRSPWPAPEVPQVGLRDRVTSEVMAGGAVVERAGRIMHGKTSPVHHDGEGLFAGLPSPLTATRYHSLIVDPATLPETLLPAAQTAEGELMAVRHAHRPVFGVQFHPESILSDEGHAMLANFLSAGAAR